MFESVLLLATFLCSLVAGFRFAFAVVVMPGIKSLDDARFIRAFQVIDSVIQKNQALFVLTWAGSVLTLIAAGVLGVWALSGLDRMLIVAAVLVYVLFVQLPTAVVNLPLNSMIQKLDPDTMDEIGLADARKVFERRWNRWNVFRTVSASVVSTLLLVLLLRL